MATPAAGAASPACTSPAVSRPRAQAQFVFHLLLQDVVMPAEVSSDRVVPLYVLPHHPCLGQVAISGCSGHAAASVVKDLLHHQCTGIILDAAVLPTV